MDGIDAFLSLRERYVLQQMQDYFYTDNYSFTIETLYPSPAQSEIRIQTQFDKTAQTTVQIFDIQGRLHWSMERTFGAGTFEFVLPIHLPSGIYILRIGDITRKFVVTN